MKHAVRDWSAAAWRAVTRSGVVEIAARTGYGARGSVYFCVGTMAVLKAVGLTPHAEGAVGSLLALGQWPIGILLLWVTSIGLCCFATWRALQSVFDVEHLGFGAKALATRVGKAVSGLLYGSLGYTVLNLLNTLRDLRKGDDQDDTVASITQTLTLPFGRSLVMTFGLLLLASGVGNMVRAFVDHFASELRCDPTWHGLIGTLARVGYFSRGAAFVPAGIFTVIAGWYSQPHTAVSIGKSLELFQTLPFGAAILAVQGLGLISFGLFGFAKAAFRDVSLEDAAPGSTQGQTPASHP